MIRNEWKYLFLDIAKQKAQNLTRSMGTSPTLKILFYTLVDLNVLPNTNYAYKKLSLVLAHARKNDKFPWWLIKNEPIKVIKSSRDKRLKEIELESKYYAQMKMVELRDIINIIDEASVRGFCAARWAGQPQRVLICIEKGALGDIIYNLTGYWDVEVYTISRYSPAATFKELADRISYLLAEAKVNVLMLTDFIAYGDDTTNFVKRALHNDYGVKCVVEKIAVTLEQVKQYNLPAKLGDKGGFGNSNIELEALLSIASKDELALLLDDAIGSRFNLDISDEVHSKEWKLRMNAETQLKELSPKLSQVKLVIDYLINKMRNVH